MLVDINLHIPEVTARSVRGIEGFDHVMTDVHTVGVTKAGLVVAGTLFGTMYFCAVEAQTFYVWWLLYDRMSGINFLKFVPEPTRLRATQTSWSVKRSHIE